MWFLPRPGVEHKSPALAGRFFTSRPPGQPWSFVLAITILKLDHFSGNEMAHFKQCTPHSKRLEKKGQCHHHDCAHRECQGQTQWERRGNCFRVRDLAGGLRSSHHPNDALVSLVGPFHHPTWIGAREMIYPSTTWTNLLVLTDWYNGKDLGWNQELWVQFRAVSWDKFLNVPQLQFSHLKGVRMKWDEVKKGTNSNCRALSPL